MLCSLCDGTGWTRRQGPHPYIKGCMVWFSRVCRGCKGKTTIEPPAQRVLALEETK